MCTGRGQHAQKRSHIMDQPGGSGRRPALTRRLRWRRRQHQQGFQYLRRLGQHPCPAGFDAPEHQRCRSLPDPGDLRAHRPVDSQPDHDQLRRLDHSPVRFAARPAPGGYRRPAGGQARPGSQRLYQRERLLQRLLATGGDRRRPTSPARRLRPVGNLRHLAGQSQCRCPRHGRLLRHAGTRRLRQLSRPFAGRDPASDDGHLPQRARQPEGRPRHRPPPGRKLRPRSDAVDVAGAVQAQSRRHQAARPVRQSAGDLQPGRHQGPGQGVHRLELVFEPAGRRHLLRLAARRRVLGHADDRLQPVPLDLGKGLPGRHHPGLEHAGTPRPT